MKKARFVPWIVLIALSLMLPALAQNTAIQPAPRGDDWWKERHASMNDRVKQGNVDMIFIGDSITHGWEGEGKAVWDQYYAGRNAVNLGISGDKTEHVLWRLDNGNIAGISPKLAVIMIGTNNFDSNTAEQIGEGLQAIINKLRNQLPQTKILLLAIFPRTPKPGPDREKLAQASAIAAKLADGNMVHYMDIGRAFLEADGTLPPEIMPDFLHPNAKGYQIWADAIEPKVAELMGETAEGKAPIGFVQLFDGKTLTGWKGLVENPKARAAMSPEELAQKQVAADESMRQHWRVENGVLAYDGKGDSLCTARDYEDFEMLVDWKIGPKGDSGIYVRGAPQIQIWDPAQWPQGSGGLYNNEKNPKDPLVCADKPIGEWNTFRIKMIGEKVTVWLNDKLIVDDVTLENYWERDKPIYPSGQIELQNHSSELWFRNIFIREIPRGEGWQDLFNGKDLSGWEQVGGTKQTWGVENGLLYTSGGEGGWLSTTKEYGDFELELEFNVPKDGNSGVFIRAPREGNPAFEGSEIQVLDDDSKAFGELKPWQFTGSVYATIAPSRRASLAAGTWQKFRIKVQGMKITVNLNGVEIVNGDLSEHTDKLKDHPGLKRTKGYIGLQNHGSRLDYRNIRIREL
ncbi:MAG TPA: DUF1080 domain-containing protein [Candidatus Hydrogenedentes bacterium]|mgnify:CR=1 FL=1|nr:DUF1080 domain-containing protein [Candidatus Hydrogenedentota bacterium]